VRLSPQARRRTNWGPPTYHHIRARRLTVMGIRLKCVLENTALLGLPQHCESPPRRHPAPADARIDSSNIDGPSPVNWEVFRDLRGGRCRLESCARGSVEWQIPKLTSEDHFLLIAAEEQKKTVFVFCRRWQVWLKLIIPPKGFQCEWSRLEPKRPQVKGVGHIGNWVRAVSFFRRMTRSSAYRPLRRCRGPVMPL